MEMNSASATVDNESGIDVVIPLLSEIESKLKAQLYEEVKTYARMLETKVNHAKEEHSYGDPLPLKGMCFRVWNMSLLLDQSKAVGDNVVFTLKRVCCTLIMMIDASEMDHPMFFQVVKFHSSAAEFYYRENDFINAKKFWDISRQFVIKIKEGNRNKNCSAEDRKALFDLYVCLSDCGWGMKNTEDDIIETVLQAKELANESGDLEYLANMMFNFGVRQFSQENFSSSVMWLEQSAELREGIENYDKQNQAKTLRLLTKALINMDQLSNALNCIEMANSEYQDISGAVIWFQINCMLRKENTPKILQQLLNRKDLTFEIAMSVMQICVSKNWCELAIDGYSFLCDAYRDTPHYEKIKLSQLELFLDTLKNYDEGVRLLDQIINDHHSGECVISPSSLHDLGFVVWNHSSFLYNQTEYRDCLLWYNKCLQLFPPSDTENREQCYRMISRCYIELLEYDLALEAAKSALSINVDNVQTHFLLYEIYIFLDLDDEIFSLLTKISTSANDPEGYLEVCAQIAYNQQKFNVSIRALEFILTQFSPSDSNKGHFGIILRNLIKMCITGESDMTDPGSRVVHYLTIGTKRIIHYGTEYLFKDPINEILWLSSVSWNIGLSCGKRDRLDACNTAFECCYQLMNFLPLSNMTLSTQRASLMACASTLLMIQRSKSEKEREILVNIGKKVEEARKLTISLRDEKEMDATSREKENDALVNTFLIEFEVMVYLKSKDTTDILPNIEILNIPQQKKAMLLEGIAAIIQTYLPEYNHLYQESLKLCANLYFLSSNYPKYCLMIRKLIENSKNREESFSYCEDTLNILKTIQPIFPEDELHWFIVKTFNNGIYYSKLSKHSKSEQWLSISVALLELYPRKFLLEKQVMAAYTLALAHVKDQ